jgi:hypothetical protein
MPLAASPLLPGLWLTSRQAQPLAHLRFCDCAAKAFATFIGQFITLALFCHTTACSNLTSRLGSNWLDLQQQCILKIGQL